MTSVQQTQELIEQHVHPLATELVSPAEAHGRVLREPVAAAEDMPSFDRSAMDGYAVGADDASDEFEVVDEIPAGRSLDREIEPGQAIRIFTGARMPSRGLKVVMQEHVESREGHIRVRHRSSASNVRRQGEDALAGDVLLKAGSFLEATAVALLASAGKTSVLVSKRPTLLHLTTGDEIVPPDWTPKSGQIRNSNASLISGLCRECGISQVKHLHAGDDLKTMLDGLAWAKAGSFDVVLVSGGSGPGLYDYSAKLFQELGATLHLREVDVRPGKPLIFGTSNSQIFFGLPGNALSHFVCFHLFVRRAIDRMLARASHLPVTGFLAEPMAETHNARETWWPARIHLSEGRLECRSLPWKSSGDITRLPAANGLVKVPASTPQLSAGTMVEVLQTRSLY